MLGVALGVGLFSGILFFVDASGATMTQRALAPLSLDLQGILASPLGRRLRFEERVSAPGRVRAGEQATFTLSVINATSDAVHEVVINDEPPPPLSYVNGSTTLNGAPLPDKAGRSPLAQGLARTGLNIGTIAPGGRVTLTYAARANRTVQSVQVLRQRGTISSREDVVPLPANAHAPLTLERLRAEIGRIPGVAQADSLSFVDLPPASVQLGAATLQGPVRLFAFESAYQQNYPSIRVVRGRFAPGSVVVSAEASRALGAGLGAWITVRLPGQPELRRPVSGIVDLAQAEPLFTSRKSSKLDDFLYMPFAVIVPPETFSRVVVPAFQAASAEQGTILKNLPVSEVDVLVDRSRLRAEPAAALLQTNRVARAIRRIAPAQIHIVDNISNALAVASDDAAVGKRMFLFLGLPAMLLAAFLAVFAANIHAEAQRREHATLRLHGAHLGHVLRILALKALAIAGAGAVIGTALGLLSVSLVLGSAALSATDVADLATSAAIGVGGGMLSTVAALYLPARRALVRDVTEQRKELAASLRPLWQRWHLDFALVLMAVAATALQARTARVDTVSVLGGNPASLPSRLLFAPFATWVGGTLLSVRLIEAISTRRTTRSSRFGGVVSGTLRRSLRRRSRSHATGIATVALVVAFGTNLAFFAAAYEDAKAADARFAVGSDLRITPSVQSDAPRRATFATALSVPGVAAVTPIVFKLENSVLVGPFDQDRTDLAAVEPVSFRSVAALSDSSFARSSASTAIAELRTDPSGLLVRSSRADDLSIEIGDDVQVLLARGTKQQTLRPFRVVGVFDTFPGFPQGVDIVANIETYQAATGFTDADFFLARTTESSRAGVARAAAALQSGPGRDDALRVDTPATTLNKDQSSLTAVNVRGLIDLGSVFAMAMAAAAMSIVVFGLLLQRRKEYVTLRACGLSTSKLLALVLGEAAIVACCGLGVGVIVGTSMARLFVRVLRPLFVLDPPHTIPFVRLLVLGVVVMTWTAVSAVSATAVLCWLKPTTVLREP